MKQSWWRKPVALALYLLAGLFSLSLICGCFWAFIRTVTSI